MSRMGRWATVAAMAVTLLAAAVLALALSAAPAGAFSQWQHDGAMGCDSCHSGGTPTDAACTSCHPGFISYPDDTCWTCHAPGQDTSTLSTPGTACSQECHLWNAAQKAYIIPSTHGANPHLGSSSDCTSCHATSVSIFDPGSSPHHSGQATGFSDCGACHSSLPEACGQGPVHQVPHDCRGLPPVHREQPRVQELPQLPRHEACGQGGREQQVRDLPQGVLRPHRPSTPRRSPGSSCVPAATPRGCTPAL